MSTEEYPVLLPNPGCPHWAKNMPEGLPIGTLTPCRSGCGKWFRLFARYEVGDQWIMVSWWNWRSRRRIRKAGFAL